MKDIKQIAAWLNAQVEVEQKQELDRIAKRTDWTLALAASGAAAVGAVTATKQRTGRMAAIGGITGLLGWFAYDYFKQPSPPTSKSPVKYSTGNWAADNIVAKETLDRNLRVKAGAAAKILLKMGPEDRLKLFESLRLDAISEVVLPVMASLSDQRKSFILGGATRSALRNPAAIEALREEASRSSLYAPKDTSLATQIMNQRGGARLISTSPELRAKIIATTYSSGPGDTSFNQAAPVLVEPRIESRSDAGLSTKEILNKEIREEAPVSLYDHPIATQTQQGTINAIAQQLRKRYPRCEDNPLTECMTDEEVYRMAQRTAEGNARKARSGEPANWLSILVTHGNLVKQLSLDWLLWKDLLTPLATNQGVKSAWFSLRAEPPPPVGDVEAPGLGIGGIGYAWTGTGIADSDVLMASKNKVFSCTQDAQQSGTTAQEYGCPAPTPLDALTFKKFMPSVGSGTNPLAYRLQRELFVPWCCSPDAFMHAGQRPRKLIKDWMNRMFFPFNYKTSPTSQAISWPHWGYGWSPTQDGAYWGFDKYPQNMMPGERIQIPRWWREEYIRTGRQTAWSDGIALHRIREYYKTSYWLVWAGIVYCLHSLKPIPNWYRKHALLHGVPCPSKYMEAHGRNFARCYDEDLAEAQDLARSYQKQTGQRLPAESFCPLSKAKRAVPIPMGLDGSGFGSDIPRSKVEEMLSLVVKHTPTPGSILSGDEIRQYQRRLCDWPSTATEAMRPEFGLPENWAALIQGRKLPDVVKANRAAMVTAKVIMAVCMAITSAVGGGAAAGVAAGATAAMGGLAGTVLSGVIKAGINGAFTLMADMQNSILEGRGLKGLQTSLFKTVLSVAGNAAGPVLEKSLDEATQKLAGIVSSIEGSLKEELGEAWQHTWALVGDVTDQYNIVMGDVIDDVQGFIKEGRVGGALNGLADKTVSAMIAKYSRVPAQYLKLSADQLMDEAIAFGESSFEAELSGKVAKRVTEWKQQAADLEEAAKIMMDF